MADTSERPASPPRTQRGVQTLETGGTILGCLARAREPMMLRDIAEAIDMVPSQLHPYMVSLRKIGLVEQTDRGLYTLGPFALEIGLSRLRHQNAYHETLRRIGRLVEELQLMAAITVWGLHGPTIVYVAESPHRIHANVQPGGIFRMTTTATGALFAAFDTPERTRPLIEEEFAEHARDPGRDIDTQRARYEERVKAIAGAGYSTTKDAPIPGVSAVAAPVFDHTGGMKLAVTVIGPTNLIGLDPGAAAVERLLTFTGTLSRDLGHLE